MLELDQQFLNLVVFLANFETLVVSLGLQTLIVFFKMSDFVKQVVERLRALLSS